VAVGAAVAALGPADDREQPVALLPQPGPLLAGGEVDVGLGPAARPVVLGPVELRGAEPVVQRQLERVLDAHPPLLRAVDEEQAAEGPERLPAQRLLRLLVQQQHPPAGVRQLGGGDQAGETGSHDDGVRVHDSPWAGVPEAFLSQPRQVRQVNQCRAAAATGSRCLLLTITGTNRV
jgi:hypothetical protein